MSEENLKRLIVTISGRNFPVRIKPEEEAIVKKVEKEVNEKINEYQISYQGKDIQDYMSLALLSYAFDLQKAKISDSSKVLEKKLDDIKSLFKEVK